MGEKFLFLGILFMFCVTNAQVLEGWRCETPNGQIGLCINVRRCQPLLSVLQSKGLTQENINYLRRSACGYNGRDPLVCCPQGRSIGIDGLNTNVNDNNEKSVDPTIPTSPPTPAPTPSTSTQRSAPLTQLPVTPNCGFSNISNTRVVGGIPARLGQFPWMVALGYKNSNNPNQPRFLCGGTMITDRHILTAAHCVHNRPDLSVARVGDLDLYSDDDGANPTTIPLLKAKIHEAYNERKHINDIAILTLSRPHNNPTVWPICMPLEPSLRSQTYARTYPFIAGWGVVERSGPTSPNLQTTLIPVVTNEECKQAYRNLTGAVIDNNVICAGYSFGGKDACQGDSGGPLMYAKSITREKRFEFFQIGVVSYGHQCALAGYPGVYTRVTEFLDWIASNLN